MKLRITLLALALLSSSALVQAKDPQPPKAADQPGFSGKVVETMNAASYTYVQIDTAKGKVWVAAPNTDVKVGDQVSVADGMPMKGYHSKTLNRTFDTVYFSGGMTVNGKAPGAAAPAMGSGSMPAMPANHPAIGGEKAAPVTGIKKADGGQTIAEVFASKDKLAGKEVKLRGKVVKYNAEIMSRNWIHIQDGTGAAGSNDLLVTTNDKAKVGDTILITGTLAKDKDFGHNYKYAVLVENAKVTVE